MSVSNLSIIKQIEATTENLSVRGALDFETRSEVRTCPRPTSNFRSIIHDEFYNKISDEKNEIVSHVSNIYKYVNQRVDWTDVDFSLFDSTCLDNLIHLIQEIENGSSNYLIFKNNTFLKSTASLIELCFDNIAKSQVQRLYIYNNQFHRIHSKILTAMGKSLIPSHIAYLCLQGNDIGRMTKAGIHAFFGNVCKSTIVYVDIRNNGFQKTKPECLALFMDYFSKSNFINIEYSISEFSQSSVCLMNEIIRSNRIKINATIASSLGSFILSSQTLGYQSDVMHHSGTNPMYSNNSTGASQNVLQNFIRMHSVGAPNVDASIPQTNYQLQNSDRLQSQNSSQTISTNGTQRIQSLGDNQLTETTLLQNKRNRGMLSQYQASISKNQAKHDAESSKEEKKDNESLPPKKFKDH